MEETRGQQWSREAEERWNEQRRWNEEQAEWLDVRPYSQFQRIAYGSWWTLIASVLLVASTLALASAPGSALIGLGLGALAGRYAFRLWTWQARRLVFFIIF